jgi:hypothetical protein
MPTGLEDSQIRKWNSLVCQKSQRLELGDLEWLSASDVGARQLVVTSYHVRLRFGEAGAIAFVGPTGQLGPLTAHDPSDLIFAGLPALGADKSVWSQLGSLVEKVAFFHDSPPGRNSPLAWGFPSGSTYFIL